MNTAAYKYRVTRVSDGYTVLSAWPRAYLGNPEYAVFGPEGTRIATVDELVAL